MKLPQQTLRDRLNNPGIIRTYRHMIQNSPTDIVEELRKNLNDNCENHPKLELLEQDFVARLGK